MNTVEISLCFNQGQQTNHLLDLLKSSNDSSLADLRLEVRPMYWGSYKPEITNMALYGRGVDISQVGFPLTPDLVGMNVLRVISPQMLAHLGREALFHPNIWKIAKRHKDGILWSLPWMVDPRAIFYWKDLLEDADVTAETAFQSAESMEAACQQIKAHGIEAPWVWGLDDGFAIVHSAASWVWGKGGDFISPEGTRAAFFEKNALDGLEAYFRLRQYMPQAGRPLSVAEANRLFVERKSAMTCGPYGFLREFRAAVPAEFRDLLGVAMPPGPPLIAGSDLVVWAHSWKTEEMFRALDALFNVDVQLGYAEHIGNLPVTRAALDRLSTSADANVVAFVTAIETGRIFAVTQFAGILEVQLAGALAALWAELSEQPTDDIRSTLQKALDPVRRRFDMLNGA